MYNKALLIGNVGKDPVVEKTGGGTDVARLSLATSMRYKDKEGEQIEKTTWHNCTAFGKVAELIGKYVQKGSKVFIEGRIDNTSTEKDGVKRYFSSVIIEQIKFLDGKPKDGEERKSRDKVQNADDFQDDDIPY